MLLGPLSWTALPASSTICWPSSVSWPCTLTGLSSGGPPVVDDVVFVFEVVSEPAPPEAPEPPEASLPPLPPEASLPPLPPEASLPPLPPPPDPPESSPALPPLSLPPLPPLPPSPPSPSDTHLFERHSRSPLQVSLG